MPSLEESRRQVREQFHHEDDHDAILAGLQREIDQHNAIKDDLRDTLRDNKSRGKFRFKSRDDERRTRSKRKDSTEDGRRENGRKRKRRRDAQEEAVDEQEAAHPFPREPTDPEALDLGSQDAFRASLFDALADDEGAASYWEEVYSQPIHVYPRPSVENVTTGKLESMSDEEYVEYVKRRMWEKKNPEIVLERQRKEKERKLEEERRTREREEFVRRKEQKAWGKSQRKKYRSHAEEREFAGEANTVPEPSKRAQQQEEYTTAWNSYLSAWDQLKRDLLAQNAEPDSETSSSPSKRIPWPVLSGKPAIKPHIEAFFSHAPTTDSQERIRILKAERVRWHPDKMQQRFRGAVNEGTMKIVTGVFQIVDSIWEEERKKG